MYLLSTSCRLLASVPHSLPLSSNFFSLVAFVLFLGGVAVGIPGHKNYLLDMDNRTLNKIILDKNG